MKYFIFYIIFFSINYQGGLNILHFAARENHIEICQIALNHGVDVKATTKVSGEIHLFFMFLLKTLFLLENDTHKCLFMKIFCELFIYKSFLGQQAKMFFLSLCFEAAHKYPFFFFLVCVTETVTLCSQKMYNVFKRRIVSSSKSKINVQMVTSCHRYIISIIR